MSLQSKGLSRVFSNTSVQKHQSQDGKQILKIIMQIILKVKKGLKLIKENYEN